jgi:hypothetical protein
MPSVKEGRVLTGLSRRNVAVEELFRSEIGVFGSAGGALNWKNSYSAGDVLAMHDLQRALDNLPPAIAP